MEMVSNKWLDLYFLRELQITLLEIIKDHYQDLAHNQMGVH